LNRGLGSPHMTSLARSILIVAGGTGGHIYPALAVADHLKTHHVSAVWLGSEQGLETRIVPEAGIVLYKIAVSGLRGRGFWRWLMAPFALGLALVQALIAIMRIRPMLVLGMGGFASGPGGVAAWICRRPLVIHEQNAIPGLTNSVLSRIATKVLQGFPGSFPNERQAITVGNPIRESIVSVSSPDDRLHESDVFRILVIGGSRGAQALNLCVPRAIERMGVSNLEIWHQAGAGNDAATHQAYGASTTSIRVSEFIDDMATAYSWANLVICRAGAITVGELAAVGVASILVPFPYAVDDHQSANASYLVDANAALLIAEGPQFEQRLADAMQKFYDGQHDFMDFARRARALAKPDAAALVAGQCMELLDV
jgi:UDP-N-acetylglucosamine--N-acetylmuramyl-(pentapeptide) pyrophosphoryl-undecaprenol N-acetylglucosamine transferase